MAIGPLYESRNGWTILQLGGVSAENYRRSGQMAKHLYNKSKDKGERSIISGMVSDCEYAAKWLESGRRPGSVRGVERAYKVRTWDPQWIDRYASPSARYVVERETVELTEHERFMIEEAMRDLSYREKQCYMLHAVDGMSFEEIARELYVGRSTVQKYIERAREKIENAKLTSLFLLG